LWRLKAIPHGLTREKGQMLSTVLSAKQHAVDLKSLASSATGDAASSLASDAVAWALVDALWGSPELTADDARAGGLSTRETQYEESVYRRKQLSAWLRDMVGVDIARARVRLHDDLNPDDVDALIDVLDALSLGRVDVACAIARRLKDYQLAMLIAQTPGDPGVKRALHDQLALWRRSPPQQASAMTSSSLASGRHRGGNDDRSRPADVHINRNRLRLYALLAGRMAWPELSPALPPPTTDDGRIAFTVCHGLDWKRALALHFWCVVNTLCGL
jgi:hypothetical protein